MEAQAIHYKKKYGSVEACHEKSDGLAIISFLFQVHIYILLYQAKMIDFMNSTLILPPIRWSDVPEW